MTILSEISLPKWNPKEVDPSILTFNEWLAIIDKDEKTHPGTAYDMGVEELNSYDKKKNYPELLQRIKRNGITFEIRLKREHKQYIKRLPNGDVERVNGQAQYFTDEEIKSMGRPVEDYTITVWDGDTKVGTAEDEWGAMLVVVAREYRKFGLGTLLTKLAMTVYPDKSSGGFTPSGKKVIFNTYQEFVRDAIKYGKYTQLVKQKQISIDRVREILASAGLPSKKSTPPEMKLNIDDPKDWLLYVGEYGDFILYDRKIKDILDGGDHMYHWIDRMILGAVNVRVMTHRDPWAVFTLFGGDTPKIKKFMMKLALSFAKNENIELWVDVEDMDAMPANGQPIGEPTNKTGKKRVRVNITGDSVPYKSLGKQESLFRKSFDKYDEFKNRLLEMAYSKFR